MKLCKYICILILVSVLSVCFSYITFAQDVTNSEIISYGDVNEDYSINAEDALVVLKHSAKLELIEEILHKKADVDGNAIIDASDALDILKYAANIISSFPIEELITPVLTNVPTATPEPTAMPVFNGNSIEVKELNDVATVEGDVITFKEPLKHFDGVEMNNPFAGTKITDGITISFRFTPDASYFATDKGYTSLLVFVNETTNEMLKLDAEGTYEYSDSFNRFKTRTAHFAVGKGYEYFMTCVITPNGVKYYADGMLIKVEGISGLNESVAYSKLLPLLSASDTKLYVGGTDSLYFMAATSRHELAEGSVVSDVISYAYPMTGEEVYSLYKVSTYEGESNLPSDFSGKVWIIGDSIAAYHEKTASVRPLYGWGELINEYFSSDVRFYNMGISSQSTSSYYSLRRPIYDYIFSTMKENDYAIISFGHNDHNAAKLEEFGRMTSALESTDTEYSFKWWLKNYYIDPVLKRGATPILMSAVVRCTYKGMFYEEPIHMQYGPAMEELVEEYAAEGIKIYYIDAQDYTYNLYSTIAREEARLYHGQYGSESGNYFDNTHYSEAGARMISEYIISELKKTDLSITEYILE